MTVVEDHIAVTEDKLKARDISPAPFAQLPTPMWESNDPRSGFIGALQDADRIAELLRYKHYRIVFYGKDRKELQNWVCADESVFHALASAGRSWFPIKAWDAAGVMLYACDGGICAPIKRLARVQTESWHVVENAG